MKVMLRVGAVSVLLVVGCGSFDPVPFDETTTTGSGSGGPPPPSTMTSTSTTGAETTGIMTTGTSQATVETIGDPDDSSDEGMGFIEDHDGGYICHSCCDLWAQDCPAGEKCSAWANDGGDDWNGTRCSPIAHNPGQPGDACMAEGGPASGVDDCDVGAMCWGVDPDTLEGTCAALCTGDESTPQCEDPSTDCIISNDGAIILCLPQCNPLASECPADQACVASDTDFVCVSTTAGIDAAVGEACQYVYDCQPGLTCDFASDVGPPCERADFRCCTPYCDLSAPDPVAGCPDAGQQCVPWEGVPPPLANVGRCLLPGA